MILKDSKKYVSCSGSGERPIFSSVVQNDGSIELVQTGKEDFYGYIQSFAESVDINVLLARYMNGDIAALNRAQGFYADVTGFPKNNVQLLQIMIDGQRVFDEMPLAYRQRFDNDFLHYDSSAFTSLTSCGISLTSILSNHSFVSIVANHLLKSLSNL